MRSRLERVARKDCVSHDTINGGDPCFAWGG